MSYPEPKFLVQELFAIGMLSLTSGPSGAAKTHLTLQNAHDAMLGKPVFGYPCLEKFRPVYFCYDRPIEAIYITLNKMGLDFTGRMKLTSKLFNPPPLRLPTKEEIGNANFIILDGVDFVVPDGKIIDLGAGGAVTRDCYRLARATDSHINGLVGHGKNKGEGNGNSFSREKAIGTTAWGRAATTMIVMEKDPQDLEGPNRFVTLNLMNEPTRRMHYRFDKNNWLMPVEEPIIEIELPSRATTLLSIWPGKGMVSTGELWAVNSTLKEPLSKATFYRAIEDLKNYHRIEQVGEGEYRLKDTPPN